MSGFREAMTQEEWLTSTDPAEMLAFIRTNQGDESRGAVYPTDMLPTPFVASDRRLRLFAAAAWRIRRPYYGGLDKEDYKIIASAEDMANGMPLPPDCPKPQGYPRADEYAPFDPSAIEAAQRMVEISGEGESNDEVDVAREARQMADVLRDIFGNPWCPGRIGNVILDGLKRGNGPACWVDPNILVWNNGIIPNLAEQAYHKRQLNGLLDPQRLLILADALEEAGCDDPRILGHLREDHYLCQTCKGKGGWLEDTGGSEPWGEPVELWVSCQECEGKGKIPITHVRGCWVVDLLSGRS